jgi:hypothetical protein
MARDAAAAAAAAAGEMVAERRPSFVQDCKEAGFVNACERQWHRTVAHAKAFPCELPISLSTVRGEIVFFCSSSSSFYSFYDTVKESVRAKIFQELRVVVKLSQGKSTDKITMVQEDLEHILCINVTSCTKRRIKS